VSLTKDTATLTYREWKLLRDAWLDSDDFDPALGLLAKLDWHCADTYEPPADDGREWPQSRDD
jgi:hypothetical protein